MNSIINEEVEGTIRAALKLMETQDAYTIACFLYALGHANGCLEMSAKEITSIAITKARLAELR
jgi:hypothetical protein